MNKLEKIKAIRQKLKQGEISCGTWQQIPHTGISEIIASQGYDWVVIDLEHGSININELPNLFLALEANNVLPFLRLSQSNSINAHQALEAGAAGLIFPMINNADQLKELIKRSKLPPSGSRGVGFSRACLYGKNFDENLLFGQNPFIVAMIESSESVKNIESIVKTEGLDAVLIGPYDLSASLEKTGDFSSEEFKFSLQKIEKACAQNSIPKGIHIVKPSQEEFQSYVSKKFQFIAYSTDALFLLSSSNMPIS